MFLSRPASSPTHLPARGRSARRSRRALRWLTGVLTGAAAACAFAAPPSGSLQIRTLHSRVLGRDWTYYVYLPAGYERNAAPYPIAYLLHGNNGNAIDWFNAGRLHSTVDQMIDRGEIPPTVIVMPQGGTSWYVDRRERMESAFFEELMPDAEKLYHSGGRRSARVIGGTSMGGFGALRYAMLHPDMFCGVMLLSPAIYAKEPPPSSAARYVGVFGEHAFDPHSWHEKNYPALWSGFISRGIKVPMFIASGDDDLYIQWEASRLYTRLRMSGQPAALRIIAGGHNWDVWRVMLAPGLRYALNCERQGSEHATAAPAVSSDARAEERARGEAVREANRAPAPRPLTSPESSGSPAPVPR